MGARTKDSIIDHAMELIFNQGFTLTRASSEIGVDHNIISKRIRARGFAIPKPKAKPIKQLPNQEIISLYESGMSELALAQKFNVSRGAIRNRLRDSGTHIRGQSEANVVSMGQMTLEERQNRTRSANNALRGAKQCVEGRRKRAFNLESSAYENMTGIGEKEFKAANEKYNQIIRKEIEALKKTDKYKKMTPDEQLKEITKIKDKAKKDIFKQYNFQYKKSLPSKK